MAEAEDFVRRSFLRLLQDAELTKKFSDKAREMYLMTLSSEAEA
jgi:hypothetical protein